MGIIRQERFKLNSDAKANKFILAHAEDITRIENELGGIEVKIFLDPDGRVYFVPIDEISTVEVLDNNIEIIDDYKLTGYNDLLFDLSI